MAHTKACRSEIAVDEARVSRGAPHRSRQEATGKAGDSNGAVLAWPLNARAGPAVFRPMHQVFYSSAAVAPFSDNELTGLLARARVNNARLGVTGMLLYHQGSFLQALEGDPQVVESLFVRIGKDKRHHRVVALLRRDVEARYFDQWQMGFASLQAVPPTLPGYSDYLRLRGDPIESGNAAARLLAAFRDGRFRSYVQI